MSAVQWLWTGAGLGAEDSDEDILRFMQSLDAASQALERSVDAAAWTAASGLKAIHVMCRQDRDAREPDISPTHGRKREPGYTVRYDRLRTEHLDEISGAWTVLGLLAPILATINRDSDVQVPDLARTLFSPEG